MSPSLGAIGGPIRNLFEHGFDPGQPILDIRDVDLDDGQICELHIDHRDIGANRAQIGRQGVHSRFTRIGAQDRAASEFAVAAAL
jgi:hypothetical protein